MKYRIFLTHIVPKGKEIEAGISFAAGNFTRNLISGGEFEHVYSIPPSNVKHIYQDSDGIEFICSKTRIWGRPFYKISPFIEQIRLFFKIKKESSLWIYNMTMLSEILVALLRIFKPSVTVNVIVLDFTPGAPNNDRLLKRINSCDGLITLADSELFVNKNKVCLPGVAPLGGKKRFLLSGVLAEQISQISKVMEVFSKLPEIELHITGSKINQSLIEKYIEYKNIIYHGRLQWTEYLDLLHSCPFLLSTRDISAPENKCNFPSKIIESLLHNRIILSTFNYTQLKDIRIIKIGNGLDEMIKKNKKISSQSDEYLMQFANQAEKTEKLFSVKVWNKAMETIEKGNKN